MGDNYMTVGKAKNKHTFFLVALAAVAFVYIRVCEPFLGFGVHDTAEQIFRLIFGIAAPVVLMTVTDYFISIVFNRKKIAVFAVLAETILVCARYCYVFLCYTDDRLLGFTEPSAIISVSVALHAAFLAVLIGVWAFILHKAVTKTAV